MIEIHLPVPGTCTMGDRGGQPQIVNLYIAITQPQMIDFAEILYVGAMYIMLNDWNPPTMKSSPQIFFL